MEADDINGDDVRQRLVQYLQFHAQGLLNGLNSQPYLTPLLT